MPSGLLRSAPVRRPFSGKERPCSELTSRRRTNIVRLRSLECDEYPFATHQVGGERQIATEHNRSWSGKPDPGYADRCALRSMSGACEERCAAAPPGSLDLFARGLV
jgi:hypothetical protein